MRISTKQITAIAVLSALSLVLMFLIRFPIIPSAPFLEYEPADVPILVASFIYGPLTGLIMTIIVSFIQFFTLSASSGWVGFVMHVIATGTYVVTAGLVYNKFRTLKGAVLALVLGSLAMTLIMIPSNLFFTVRFYGIPYDAVVKMLPTALLPFNIIKASINSLITFIVYKSIKRFIDKKYLEAAHEEA